MSPLRIVVVGSSGRMGQELLKLIEAQPENLQLVGAIDRKGHAKVPSRFEDLKAENVDVVIDFSAVEFFPQVIEWCARHQVRLVCGTTGLSEKAQSALQEMSQKVAVLYAPNMSLGVALVNEMIKLFSQLKEYDFAVEEFHHIHKKDSPSGTALFLKKTLEQAIGKESQAACIRGGGIFGEHKVIAMGPEETISIEHKALNRTVFASGALKAALWIRTQPPGLFAIRDVLKI